MNEIRKYVWLGLALWQWLFALIFLRYAIVEQGLLGEGSPAATLNAILGLLLIYLPLLIRRPEEKGGGERTQ